jgi:hypothetical protein
LMLSSQHIRGFPCFLYPATCPSIMSRSSEFCSHNMTKYHSFNQMIVASNDLLGVTFSRTDRLVLLSVHDTYKILLHVHSSKASIFFLSFFHTVHLSLL